MIGSPDTFGQRSCAATAKRLKASRWTTSVAALAAMLAALAAAGCRPSSPERQQHGPRVTGGSQQAENFDRAFDLLDGSLEFGTDEAYLRASFFVNEWLADQDGSGWSPDPVLRTLPKSLTDLPELKAVGALEVDTEDMRRLESVLIARQLGDWIVKAPTPQLTDDWLEQADDLSAAQKLQLANAVKLFDWTTRNIYLQKVRRRPDAAIGQRVESWVGDWLATRDVLLYGQGDSWQRAAVFLELCRQQGLDGLLLACAPQGVRPDPASEELTPWAVAIAIADRLYLFDPALGLPVPGPGGQGVATLTQAAEDPSVLQYLNVGQQHRYPVGPGEIQRVYALVDASPEALSLRMKLIEERLTGKRRLTLTASVEQAAARWKDHPHIKGVFPWRLALESHAIRRNARRDLQRDPQRGFEVATKLALVPLDGETSLVQGRKLHLRGVFELDANDKPGAKGKYMETRVPQTRLDLLPTDAAVQRELGVGREAGEREEDWRQRLAMTTVFYTQALWHTSYWLALIQFEQGNYESAISWLEKRNLETLPNSPWLSAARYNLARSLELSGRLDEARSIYLTDDSPQQHGNLIRAKLLAN